MLVDVEYYRRNVTGIIFLIGGAQMNYSADRAINSCSEDLLGRATFSRKLGQAICDYKGTNSLVMGVFGKWGTGKTSVINMALQTVEEITQDAEKKPITLRFLPWNYSDKDNLIWLFFNELQVKIELEGNEEFKKKVGSILKDYAGIFDVASLIPVAGTAVATILKTASQAGGELLSRSPDLNGTKTRLVKALQEEKQRIIVVVDDIDRLTNEQIRDIFQLVKQVGDLPNIIYVLAMDREVVSNALTEVHKFDGNEYLEKIIQIPFEIPELKLSKLYEIFFAKLDGVVNEISPDIIWDQQYLKSVFNNCIAPYLHTLRDVNRIINVFHFKYSLLFSETSFEDMVGITTIEVLEPTLYRWIINNKDAVCGGLWHDISAREKRTEEYRRYYENEFKSIGLEPEKTFKCLSALFPVFKKDVGIVLYDDYNSTNVRSQMRMAHADRFDLYFELDLDSISVPRSLINDCINTLDEDALTSAIKEINQQGNIVFFIEELNALIDKIPENRITLIATVVVLLAESFEGDVNRFGFLLPIYRFACDFAEKLINRLGNDNERFEAYKIILQKCSMYSLGQLARRINGIELAYGRLAGKNEDKAGQIISIEGLEELEVLFVERAKELFELNKTYEIDDFGFIIYLWKCFDENSANEYINSLLSDETKKLKLLCLFAGRWTGSNSKGWGFNPEDYSEYFPEEEILELIEAFDKKRLAEFTELEKIKMASFMLIYGKHMSHPSEEEAKELVQQWMGSAKE